MRVKLHTETDIDRPRLRDVMLAMALLTRLPLPAQHFDAESRPAAAAAWAYPVVGLVVGLLLAAVGTLLIWLGLPAPMVALLILAIGLFLTGAMHEDGLADCADGFWGGWTRERRLEIMKDSQIGTYGVLALVLSIALRWQGIVWMLEANMIWALIAVECVSRAAMVSVMAWLPHARTTGLAHQTGTPGRNALLIAAGLGGAAALTLPGGILAVGLAGGMAWLCAAVARAKIGGQTGDVLGATQQVNAVALLILVAVRG